MKDLLSTALRDRLDGDARPLGEVGSPLYPADTREVACPYPGARAGLPMNATALAQYRRARARVLATLGRVSTAAAPALFDACARIAATALAAPAPCDPALAALYKVSMGLTQVVVAHALDDRPIPDGAALHAWLEEGRWLIGARQTCAGSPADIAEVWDTFTGRRAAPAAAPIALVTGSGPAERAGLTIALLLATQALYSRGEYADEPLPLGARLRAEPTAPWMVVATMRHDRVPAAAARLFERVPRSLATFLERCDGADHGALEALFLEAAERGE